jgi:transcription elongation GreA/GreB family factor
MNMKKTILDHLKLTLEEELKKARDAYETSHKHATDSELKADGKYDTRSIEAGYLAGAQKKRVEELELEIKLIEEVNLDHVNDTVSVGSLVSLKHNNQQRKYFISSTSGGSMIKVEDEVVLVISAFSPLGSEVIGLKKGDSFEIEVSDQMRDYEVLDIL